MASRIVDQRIKDKLIEKWRDVNVDGCNWWADVYADMLEELEAIGVDPNRMAFTGFCSQGDGASFAGRICEWELFLKQFKDEEYPWLRKAFEEKHALSFVWDRMHSQMVHERSCYYELNYETFVDCWACSDQFMLDVRRLWDKEFEKEMNEFQSAAKELLITYMQKLYKNLEAEYEHLTSDEVVWEWILENPFFDGEVASIDEED